MIKRIVHIKVKKCIEITEEHQSICFEKHLCTSVDIIIKYCGFYFVLN